MGEEGRRHEPTIIHQLASIYVKFSPENILPLAWQLDIFRPASNIGPRLMVTD